MRNTRAWIMMVVAIVVAFGAVIVAARWINAQASGTTNKVAVALVDISLGARLSPEMVRMVDWPSSAMPPGAFTDAKLVETRVARTSIQLGEPIMEGKLAPPGTKGGLSAVVADGKRAMTVRVNDVVGVAGFALPGNFVDILVNTQEEGAKNNANKDLSISKIVLERILVLAVAQESSRDETKPKVVNAVTLELTPDQAEKLDLARSVGTLSLVLRNQIDPNPVNTEGATKTTLLDVKAVPVAVPAPAAKPAKVKLKRAVIVRTPAPGYQVEVIKGLDRSTQQF
ncbi:Flp pilus assembly protein CpaB [Noviherbaspirillum sedimenti]|uniref:Flp pilus assembly protein CpaB n=1 Tax=Noviherbaspirillum sedimenti TaxID=2320865 RepID=A0A3A3G6T7_9BURK|nr:Flp pilus assembly protein CpaB [Noviherbaspirillum sedimenti]RJG03661.1 Flp pilus assembly protein CpaB [Noviherbaspirillum sedimenti]